MYRIVIRHATKAARLATRADVSPVTGASAPFPDVVERLDIIAALSALPLVQRTIVVLYYYAGYTSPNIARILKMQAVTVRFHLMLARRTLKATLSERVASPNGTARSNHA